MKALDITGQRFNRLVAVKFVTRSSSGRRLWEFLCDCGNRKVLFIGDVTNNHTKSCGCIKLESKPNLKHDKSYSRVYGIWRHMVQRCTNTNNDKYKYYGGRGIIVCERWMKFENFYVDMGEPPKGYTIDRIDNNGNYTKENCEWVSMILQANNKSNNLIFTINGTTKTLSEWVREYKIRYATVYYRLISGKTIQEALGISR